MTALINDRNTHYKDGINLPFKMAGNTEIFAGSLVVANAAGKSVAGTVVGLEAGNVWVYIG